MMRARTGPFGAGALTLAVIAALCLAAAPAGAQGIASPARQRYERATRGSNVSDFARKLRSDDPLERLEGVRSLSQSGDEAAIEYLVQALGDPDHRVQCKAIDGLAALRATAATPVLIQQLFLRTTPLPAKRRILAALGKIGDPSSARAIVEFLERELDTDTRGTAIFALGEIGSDVALSSLEKIAADDSDPVLRRLASEAIEKIHRHQAALAAQAPEPQETFLRPEPAEGRRWR